MHGNCRPADCNCVGGGAAVRDGGHACATGFAHKMDLSELIPKLRLKRNRLLHRYSGIFIILLRERGLVGGY